ncbi:protein of unknown function [Candidatus Nitrospira inopinata]|uniref:Uncharacterized protein n=1 Tax=Candidatus Nitrospira inopinata TaxID=1715989 RepID=A0A0S4KL22_9BACT|nr:protein of unknown function [Candidatus Nitrospira inopinata]
MAVATALVFSRSSIAPHCLGNHVYQLTFGYVFWVLDSQFIGEALLSFGRWIISPAVLCSTRAAEMPA